MKLCTKCKKEKDNDCFPKCKRYKSGLSSWCKDCCKELSKKWNRTVYRKNPEYFKEKMRVQFKKNPEKFKIWRKKSRQKIRIQALKHYSKNDIKCSCCGESEIKFLALDHINNDGNLHRKKINNDNIYWWLKRNNYPDGFQVLCHNCNMAKSFYGSCPHSRI